MKSWKAGHDLVDMGVEEGESGPAVRQALNEGAGGKGPG